ncbi:MAG: YfiR family protein [Chthoniobacterales bacterium]
MNRSPLTFRLTRSALCVIVALGSLATPLLHAESEYDVKAAYLFKFTKFVEWPSSAYSSPQAPFVIGIVGRDPFGGLDRILEGKQLGEHEFQVRTVSAGDAAGLRACQMIFVTAAEQHRLGDILAAVQGRAVLVVGETEGFAGAGGTLGFDLRQSRLGVEVNSAAAQRARLKISSQLLNIAKIVN